MSCSDGSLYEGEFLDDSSHGYGKMTWANGTEYEGMWKEGDMDGDGILKEPGKEPKKVFYSRGKLIF